MYRPTLEEAAQIAESGRYGVVPLSTEMYSDAVTPIGGAAYTQKRQLALFPVGESRRLTGAGAVHLSRF